MSELLDTLRLQIAQFNNFLIENYLYKAQIRNEKSEPHTFLFSSFFNLSEHLAEMGTTFGNLNSLQPGTLIPLKEAITEAVIVAYLIDKSTGLDELTSNIQRINTAKLLRNIQSISKYGKEFDTEQVEIDAEIRDLKQDNAAYFNSDGTIKFEGYEIVLDEAIDYLITLPIISQVKNIFKKVKDTYQFFSEIISHTPGDPQNYTDNKIFIGNLLNTLVVLLIALSYIEPFFEKPNNISQFFEQHIKGITATQLLVLNELL